MSRVLIKTWQSSAVTQSTSSA